VPDKMRSLGGDGAIASSDQLDAAVERMEGERRQLPVQLLRGEDPAYPRKVLLPPGRGIVARAARVRRREPVRGNERGCDDEDKSGGWM
jgi:hypothetical protein